jgi:hypothetical protein
MSWRGRRTTAKERLWLELRDAFEDDDGGLYANCDVEFDGLSGTDILRMWDYIESRATAITERVVWDRNNEPPDETLDLAEAVARLARGELGYVSVNANGLKPRRVPPVALELWPDAVSLYWWVNDDGWDTETVAELAEFLGELRALVPHARLAYEELDVEQFWGPVNSYLATL